MNEFLTAYNYAEKELGNSEQVVTVSSRGSSCDVCFFEKNNNSWGCILETSGIVGKNGVSDNSSEGDYCTPKGLYSLGFAFGTQPMKGVSIEYKQINNNCYWIDDPESPLYNQWTESSEVSWKSAEHLSDYPQAYKYAVVIDYNMKPVVPYKGSAIFLHCMTGRYTAGCVAIPENDMLFILKHINSKKSPIIIIN
ncbi:L,D-transpeptidase family protein [uncultured Ruminococcus sp.]|uniref:L,D-transpeptidase family protein n=1 Tax=uncultured Ruminococcus sp. TaxID=165186 RepID=UPI0025D935C9|nr:L,D-transpeptidase family protein [uncultured Ruminococcus sp.]